MDLNAFIRVMNVKSGISQRFKHPAVYYDDSARTKRRNRAVNVEAAKITGQNLYKAFGIAEPDSARTKRSSYVSLAITSDELSISVEKATY